MKPAPVTNKFTDVTKPSGLTAFVHSDGSSGRKFFVEQMGSGCAFFDYDNDGWLDIYLCNGAPLPAYHGPPLTNRLFHNNKDGTFTDVTKVSGVDGIVSGKKSYSIGCAVGDFDNDGNLDLFVTNFGPDILYRNNGNGIFTDVTGKAGVGDPRLGSSAAFVDYDRDGYLDLYVCNYVKYLIAKDLWCSKFRGHKSYCGPNLYDPEVDTLYHNNRDGTFTDASVRSGIRKKAYNGLGVVTVDYDEDGWLDIYVANDQTPNLLWRNNHDGTFTDVAVETGSAFGEEGASQAGMGVDAGDYNGDGKMDLFVTNFSEEPNALYKNEGGTFIEVSNTTGVAQVSMTDLGFGCGFIDFDADGWLDLFVTNGHVLDDVEMYSDVSTWKQPRQLLRNLGNGTFEEVTKRFGSALLRKAVGRGTAFGDYDNDGDTDILITNTREQPQLLRNDCAHGHSLQLILKASWGNPQSIGTVLWVTVGKITQRRDVRTCGSYASSSDVRPIFGLGDATRAESVKIRWPSGQETVLRDVQSDQVLEVNEPVHDP